MAALLIATRRGQPVVNVETPPQEPPRVYVDVPAPVVNVEPQVVVPPPVVEVTVAAPDMVPVAEAVERAIERVAASNESLAEAVRYLATRQRRPVVRVVPSEVMPAPVTVQVPEQKPRALVLEYDDDGNVVKVTEV